MNRSLRPTRAAWLLGLVSALLLVPGTATANVSGTPPAPFQSHRVFGDGLFGGNTLMGTVRNDDVNSVLFECSQSSPFNIPADARIVSATLWWSGSVNNDPSLGPTGIDDDIDLDVPGGQECSITAGTFAPEFNDIPADDCFFSDAFADFFYCRTDVTNIVDGLANPAGVYAAGDVISEPGALDPNNPNACTNASCTARYAGWSLIIVFDSPTQITQRDVVIFDGFLNFDEANDPNTPGGAGIAPPFTMSGFQVGPPGLVSLSLFGLEGDNDLGVPPQNLANPNSPFFCTTCEDFMRVGGPGDPLTKLFSNGNEPGNLFNSSGTTIASSGVDLDTFNIGSNGLNLLGVGDTSLTVQVGSGDGILDNGNLSHGGGESVFLGWVMLTVTRPSPRFNGVNTRKFANTPSASVGGNVTFFIQVANEGDQTATNVIVRDAIPAGTTYVPNSTRVNGSARADVGGTSPLVGGLNLGTLTPLSQGGTTQLIEFTVSVNANASGNISNVATIESSEVNPAIPTNTVTLPVETLVLGIPEKRVNDLTAPVGEFRPGDLISYTITVKGSAQGAVNGIEFVDDLPSFLRLIDVAEPAGTTDASSLTGGANGTGQVRVTGINLTQNGSVNFTIIAQVFSEAEFNNAGIASDQIDGRVIANQGKIQAAFLPAPVCTGNASSSPQCTDDPTTGVVPDSTNLTLRFAPDLATSVKLVQDENGGPLEPGDSLRYTIRLTNTGNLTANTTITDNLPAGVNGASFAVVSVPAGVSVNVSAPPAGTNGTGSFSAAVSVPPGQTREIIFTVLVDANAANGTAVTNVAQVVVENFPNKNVTLTSQTLTVFSTPDLGGTTKAVLDQNGGNPRPGDALRYTITIPNNGNRDATNVVVTDVIDADLVLNVGSISNGGVFNAATRTITWNLGSIAEGAQVVLTYDASIVSPLADGAQISNQASIASTEVAQTLSDDPSTAAPDDPTVLVVISAPLFTGATKTVVDVGGAPLQPGDTVEYSLSFTNEGDAAATGVVVTDLVDLNLTNVVPQDGGVFDAATRTITWNLAGAVLNPGDSRTVRFSAVVVTPLANNTEICNQGNIDSDQTAAVVTDDPSTADPDDATCLFVFAEPQLVFTKEFEDITGGTTIPGDPVRYTLTITNEGDAPATGVVVTDIVDANLLNVLPSAPGVFNAATRTITWTIATPIVPGTPLELTFDATLQFPLADNTQVCNQATVATTEVDDVLSDDLESAAPADPTCVNVISAPDLGTSIKAFADDNGGDPRPGDVITYTITVKNTGTEDATAVTISDPLDANLAFVAGSASDGGVFDAVTRTVNWALAAPVAANGQKVVTFQATILLPLDNGTEIANQASVDADRIEPTLTDDAATPPPPNEDDPTVFAVVSSPDFGDTTKTVVDVNGGLKLPGDVVTYTITVKNTGDMIGRRTTVTDVVDLNLEEVTVDQGGLFDAATRTITWNTTTTPALANVGLSPAGDVVLSFTARIKADVTDGTVIANQASVTHEDPAADALSDDPATAEEDDPTLIVVGFPDFENFTKEVLVQGGGAAEPLKILEYTLTVRNEGSAPATNIVVLDPIDVARLDQVTPGQGGIFAGNQIRWDGTTTPALAVLDPDEVVELSFTARVRAGTPDGDAISNQATLAFAELPEIEPSDDPATVDENDDPTVIVVSALPDYEEFTLTVTDENAAPFAPGDPITYTLTLRNQGDGQGRNLVVTQPIPVELTDVVPGQGGVFDEVTRIARWDSTTTPELGGLDVGAEQVLTLAATIVAPLADGTDVESQAALVDDFLVTPEPSDDPATAQTDDPTVFEVVSGPLFTGSPKVGVDVNGGLLQPGDLIRYTIQVTNSGTDDSAGVTLVDSIPAGTTYVIDSTTLNGAPVADVGGNAPTVGGLLVNSPGAPAGVVLPGAANAAEVSFLVAVNAEVVEGTLISNQGEIAPFAALTDDPNVGGEADPTVLVVGEAPNLTDAAKTSLLVLDVDGDGNADIGDRVAFILTVSNQGSDVATAVVIEDPIPAENALYAPGTLTLNGAPLTDVADGDDGEVLNNLVTVRLDEIAPGESAEVRVEVEVVAGPTISNQGSVDSAQTAPELTDSDGNDNNGDQPTIVLVGDGNQAVLLVSKTAEDANGGDVETGDTLRYRIEFQNVGNVDTVLSMTDELPEGVEFVGFVQEGPAGSTIVQKGGVVVLSDAALEAGESFFVSFEVTVTAAEGEQVCNVARATALKARAVESDEACVLVGASAGTGGFAGQVFRDFGVDNQVFDQDIDQALPGFEVRIFSAQDLDGDPVATAVVAPGGDYSVLSLPAGDYVARVFSEEGVFFAESGTVSVVAGEATPLALPVDPMGLLYDAQSARAVPGARVFLFFDETDPLAPNEQVGAELLREGQQGQRTGRFGLYTFDAPAGRTYRLSVVPAGPTQLFPSSLIPPAEGFAQVEVEDEVTADDTPDLEDATAERYFLRFDFSTGVNGIDRLRNNHLPLDPLRSLLRLSKKSMNPVARIGEIVTYQIRLENRGAQAIENLDVVDILPEGFRLLTEAVKAERLTAGGRERIDVTQPATPGRLATFGGLTVGAGETIQLTYQTVIRVDVAPGVYENTAQAFLEASPATDPDTAKVRVELDPDFAESVLIGKVFCDDNRDGWQDVTEVGVPYARIYLDTGTYVETDAFGKYHVTGLNPGMHLAKIDTNTLPAPGTLTTKAGVLFHATGGLLQKANFGAICAYETAGIDRVVTYADAGSAASMPTTLLPAAPDNALVISGNTSALRLEVDGVAVPLLSPALSFPEVAGVPQIAASARPYEFTVGAAAEGASSWRLRAWEDVTGRVVLDKSGDGAPPASLPIDVEGIDGGLYRLQLSATLGDALVSSPVVSLFVAPGDAGRDVFTLSQGKGGALFSSKNLPAKALTTALTKAALAAPAAGELWRIEVYSDGSLKGKKALDATQKRAESLRAKLVKDLGVPESALVAVGKGAVSAKVKASDRKVVIRAVPAAPTVAASDAAPAFTAAPFAYLGEDPVSVTSGGDFARVLEKDTLTTLVIDIGAEDGRRVTASVVIKEPTEPEIGEGAEISGDLAAGTLLVSGAERSLALLGLSLKVGPRVTVKKTKTGAKLAKPVVLTPGVPAGATVEGWRLRILDEWGDELASLEGAGAPPASLSWDGIDGTGSFVVKPGVTLFAALSLTGPDGEVAESLPRAITVAGGRPVRYPTLRATGDGFDAAGAVNKRLKPKLAATAKKLIKQADQVYLVAVEVPGPVGDPASQREARARAETARAALVAAGVPEGALRVTGDGSAKFKETLSKTQRAALHVVRIYRIAPIEAEAQRPHVVVDGEELEISAGAFSAQLAGDGGLIDIRDLRGARLVLPVEAPRARTAATVDADTILTPDWSAAASQPSSLPGPESTIDPFAQPSSAPASRPATPEGTTNPFPAEGQPSSAPSSAPASAPSAALEALPFGAGGDLPPPKRRPKAEPAPEAGAGGDLPTPKRRPKPSDGSAELPLPKRRPKSSDTPAPAEVPVPKRRPTEPKVTGKTPRPSTGSAAPVAATATPAPAVSAPMPSIGAPIPVRPSGTASSQPVELPSDPAYSGFGEAELEAFAARAQREAELRAQGIDPEVELAVKDEALKASQLTVLLPKDGVTLRGDRLVVQGDTDPKNKISINGKAVPVDASGHFVAKVPLKTGDSELVVQTTDTAGNVAEVRRPVRVASSSYFLMALGDVALGGADSMIPEEVAVNNSAELGPMLLQGRAALYFKGHIPGKLLFDAYNVTAHLDTARRGDIEQFFDNVIDPEKYYPVYGDASQEVREAQARGPLFVMIEADDSKLKLGALKTSLKGVELFRYERTLYGVELDLRKAFDKAEKRTTEAKLFVSTDDRSLRRIHNVFRGTGGSVYALSEDDLIEGAEKVRVVVRDPNTGAQLVDVPLSRYNDYTLDYRGGRLSLREPLPSLVDAAFLIDHPNNGATALVGAPVFLEVDFESESESTATFDARAVGGYARQQLSKRVSVGAGAIEEARDGAPNYRLLGADLQAKWSEKTFLKVEYASSQSQDAPTFASPDGGVTFQQLGLADEGTRGRAVKVSGGFSLADFTKKKGKDGKALDRFSAAAYFQVLDDGFFSNGSIFDQGQTKAGISARYTVRTDSQVVARLDTIQSQPGELDGTTVEASNTIASLGYAWKKVKNSWRTEIGYLFSDDANPEADPLRRLALAGGLERALSDRFTLIGSQEAVLFADGTSNLLSPQPNGLGQTGFGNAQGSTPDGRILDGQLDSFGERMTTTAGLRYKLSDDLSISLLESLRWDGSNATMLTLKSKLSDSLSAYATERFQLREGDMVSATILGAEQLLGQDGRSYTEYQIESAASGITQRAVLGLGKRWTLKSGLRASLAYERAQILSGPSGDISRDAAAAGLEWSLRDTLKAAAKFELRYDNGDAAQGGTDRLQTLASAGATYRLTPDWTLFARALANTTQNQSEGHPELWDRVFTLGFAYRPELSDKFNMLGKFSVVSRRAPTDLTAQLFEDEQFFALSLAPIYELSKRFGLSLKLALRNESNTFEDLATQQVLTSLLAARVNVHLSEKFDLGLEWRGRRQSGAIDVQQGGFLAEVMLRMTEYVNLGAGYNFTSFSDDELVTDDKDAGGFFIRVTGQY